MVFLLVSLQSHPKTGYLPEKKREAVTPIRKEHQMPSHRSLRLSRLSRLSRLASAESLESAQFCFG